MKKKLAGSRVSARKGGKRARRTTPVKKSGTKRTARPPDGCELTVSVVERQGRAVDRSEGKLAVVNKGSTRGRAVGPTRETARVLASAGHPARLQILWLLLKGPAVYRAVQRTTKLRPGPLYHHINQLRLAGLIRPKERDLYELTRGGRNVVLIAAALNKLARDGRSRPVTCD